VDFDTVVAQHRGELFAHCYRMLGSPHDAEDALQETLLGAWKGYAAFEGRSSVRTWLYTIATHACLKLAKRRFTSPEVAPALTQTADLGVPDTERAFVEPWASSPEDDYLRRESVELAFVAALQQLPSTQRAVLLLREVLQFSATEVAEHLGTTPASVNSALQRARATLGSRRTQQEELSGLGAESLRALLEDFMAAWEAADVDRMGALLAEDVRFTMPPLPAWFDGREMVLRFISERVFATPWRLEPMTINGQPGFLCWQSQDGVFRPGAVNVLSLRRGLVSDMSSFTDPTVVERFRTDR
jgi:RNA polymerase sigma-70 factor (TIGR02960 family)